ncbi:MAG TPA: hypothetical protein VJ723_03770 [Candidatus Angelobacter sp.]|nr:hypothetical protein [Candidatus Angelobacter sp.]
MNQTVNESAPRAYKHAVFLVLFTCLVYAQSIGFPFLHFDDTIYIVENNYVHQWASVPSFFTGAADGGPAENGPKIVANLYRPLPQVWVLLNYKLWGVQPALWHLTSVGFYVLAVCLLWRLTWKLTRDPFVAIAAALLYAMHPTHVEGVAWVSGATVETLLAVCFFGGFLAYLRWREDGRIVWLMACGVLNLLALFTKETGAALPVLIIAHAIIFRASDNTTGQAPTNRGRQLVSLLLTLGAAVAVYALLRLHALHTVMASRPLHGWGDVFRTAPLAFVAYILHFFRPVPLAPWYDINIVTTPGLINFYLPLLVCIAYLALTVWAILRKSLDGFLMLFWALTLAVPLVGIIAFPEFAIVQDRLSFVAIAGAAILVARVLALLPRTGRVLFGFNASSVAALAVIIAALGVLSALQVNTWKSDLAMCTNAIKVCPQSLRPRVLLGAEYMKLKDPVRAVAAYRDAANMAPNHWEVFYAYGIALASAGDRPEAVRAMTHAMDVSPAMTPPYMVAADLLARDGRIDEALAVLERGIPVAREPGILRQERMQLLALKQRLAAH